MMSRVELGPRRPHAWHWTLPWKRSVPKGFIKSRVEVGRKLQPWLTRTLLSLYEAWKRGGGGMWNLAAGELDANLFITAEGAKANVPIRWWFRVKETTGEIPHAAKKNKWAEKRRAPRSVSVVSHPAKLATIKLQFTANLDGTWLGMAPKQPPQNEQTIIQN